MGIDFNLAEIGMLILLGIIFFGPERLPDLARKAARVLHFLRNIANDAQTKLREELGPDYADLNLADLNPKAFVAKHLLSAEEIEGFREIRDDLALTAKSVTSTDDDLREATDAEPVDEAGAATAAEPEPRRVVAFDPEAT